MPREPVLPAELSSTEKSHYAKAPTGPGPVIRLEGISKTYPGVTRPAVDNLSLSLQQGELLALLGPSGCGKTTTLRLIAGFERPDRGKLWIREQLAAGPRPDPAFQPPERRRLGVVFQDYALFPHLTAGQNIEFGLRGRSSADRKARVKELLELTGLTGLEQRYPHQLSGGQQQRVAIARALAPRPVAVLLDEAFNSLDAVSRASMQRELRAILKAQKVSAILVTHDQAEAFALADRVAVMNQGWLEQLGQPLELYRNPATRFVAAFIGHSSWLPGQLVSLEAGEYKIRIKTGLTFTGSVNNATALANFVPGDQVEILVRPEDVYLLRASPGELVEASQGCNGSSEATILNLEFQGSSLYYTLALKGETETETAIIKCEELQSCSTLFHKPGTRVTVCFRQKQLNLFPACST